MTPNPSGVDTAAGGAAGGAGAGGMAAGGTGAGGGPSSDPTAGGPDAPMVAPAGSGSTVSPTTETPVATDPGARSSIATRLSKPEYTNSISDVLGVTLTPAELDAATGGIPDDSGDGVFKRFGNSQTSIEQHASAYFETAATVAERADMSMLAAQYASCTDPTPACAEGMTAALGRRLFRRPLVERELATLATVYDAAVQEGEDFEAAMRWTLQALLQMPQFLFHLQGETEGTAGEDRDLTGPELAARLASFIWVSVPDEELLSAAEAGVLTQPDELQSQVDRMLADPKARRLTETFVRDFSRAELASFEGATDELRAALTESVIATFQYHLWDAGGSVADLFTTSQFMVNAEVAELLGVPYTGDGLELVDVSTLPERVGLMTHPGTIAGMGDRDIGSFVNRGKYLMERLLCRNPIAVPAALLNELEEFNQDTTGLNEHERAAIRMTRPECWGCHTQFEPLAFGFSRYDGAGRYVGDMDPEGRPLPLDGYVPVASEANSPKYSNIAEYMQILATDESVQTCMTEHFLSFATSRTTDPVAKAHAPDIGAAYQLQGSTLQAMVSAVARSDLFRRMHVLPVDDASTDVE